jgi:hypothetical protein
VRQVAAGHEHGMAQLFQHGFQFGFAKRTPELAFLCPLSVQYILCSKQQKYERSSKIFAWNCAGDAWFWQSCPNCARSIHATILSRDQRERSFNR